MPSPIVKIKFFRSPHIDDSQNPGDSLESKINAFLATIALADFLNVAFMASDQGWNFAYVTYKG
jgi:hypothetical protein